MATRVTVVIPTYNYGRYVGQAIDSVLNQSHADLDLIVVDDASTDDTDRVVGERSDPRLTYIRQANAGPATARNRGLGEARGAYVALLDADDWWEPEKLARQVGILDRDPAIGLVATDYRVRDETTGAIAERRPPALRGNVLAQMAVENRVPGSATTALMRRSVLERVGLLDPSLKACEDWDLFQRFARVSRFEHIQIPLAWIRLHGPSNSDIGRLDACFAAVIRKFYSDPTLPPEIARLESRAWATAALTLARRAFIARQRPTALRYIAAAVRADSRWADPYLLAARGITGQLRRA